MAKNPDMLDQRWLIYAILAAACASCVPIFAKLGMREIDDNLATAIRSVVMTLFVFGICTALGVWSKLHSLHVRALAMIALSGVAGASSWLFYFKAIHWGKVSQVAPIDKLSMPIAIVLAMLVLGDRPSRWNWLGIALIAGGAYLATLSPHK